MFISKKIQTRNPADLADRTRRTRDRKTSRIIALLERKMQRVTLEGSVTVEDIDSREVAKDVARHFRERGFNAEHSIHMDGTDVTVSWEEDV